MNADLLIAYADVPGFDPATVIAAILVTLVPSLDPTNPLQQSVTPGTKEVIFASVPADSYGISVGAVDANQKAIGQAATGNLTISAPQTISLSLPASVTATQT